MTYLRICKSINSVGIVDALDEWLEWQVVANLAKYRCYGGMYANIHCLRTLECTLVRITSEPLSLLCIRY